MKIIYNGTQKIKHYKVRYNKKIFNVKLIDRLPNGIVDMKISIEPTTKERIEITKNIMKELK